MPNTVEYRDETERVVAEAAVRLVRQYAQEGFFGTVAVTAYFQNGKLGHVREQHERTSRPSGR